MRREERVTVQGPVKKQQPDGMSHGGGGAAGYTPLPSKAQASPGGRVRRSGPAPGHAAPSLAPPAPPSAPESVTQVDALPPDAVLANAALQRVGALPFGSGSAAPCASRGPGIGVIETGARCWTNINHGAKGDGSCWSPGHSGPKFVGVRLAAPSVVSYLSLGPGAGGGRARLQYTAAAGADHATGDGLWRELGAPVPLPSAAATYWRVDPPVTMAAVRVVVDSPSVCLDELEVFTTPPSGPAPDPPLGPVLGASGGGGAPVALGGRWGKAAGRGCCVGARALPRAGSVGNGLGRVLGYGGGWVGGWVAEPWPRPELTPRSVFPFGLAPPPPPAGH